MWYSEHLKLFWLRKYMHCVLKNDSICFICSFLSYISVCIRLPLVLSQLLFQGHLYFLMRRYCNLKFLKCHHCICNHESQISLHLLGAHTLNKQHLNFHLISWTLRLHKLQSLNIFFSEEPELWYECIFSSFFMLNIFKYDIKDNFSAFMFCLWK